MSTDPNWEHELRVGGRVFWDVSSTQEPLHIVEGRVISLDDENVTAQPVRRWDRAGATEIPVADARTIPLSYFEKPLEERIRDTGEFWERLAGGE